MAELDLTAAIDAAAIATGMLPSGPGSLVDTAVRAAAPLIERAVLERLSGPANPFADLGAEVRVSIRHRGHQWGSSKVISDEEIEETRSPVDPVQWSLLRAVDEVFGAWREADGGR